MTPDSSRVSNNGGGHGKTHRSPPVGRDSSERRENRNDHQSSNISTSVRGDGMRRSEDGSQSKSKSVDRSRNNNISSSSSRRSRESKMPPPSSSLITSSGARIQDDRRERSTYQEQRQSTKPQTEMISESRGKKRTQADASGDVGHASNKRRDADVSADKLPTSAGTNDLSTSAISASSSVHRRVSYNHTHADSQNSSSGRTKLTQKSAAGSIANASSSSDTIDGSAADVGGARTSTARSAAIKLHRIGHQAAETDGVIATTSVTTADGSATAAPTLIRRTKQQQQQLQPTPAAAPAPEKVRGSWKYLLPDEASRVLDDIMHEKVPSEMLYTSDSSALHLFERIDAFMQSCVQPVFNRQQFERDLKEIHYFIEYLKLRFRVNMRISEVVKNAIDKNVQSASMHETNMKNADEQMLLLKQREEQLKQYEIWCQDYAKDKKQIDEEMSTEEAEAQIQRVQEATDKAKLSIAKSKKKLNAMRIVAFLSQISSEILLRADTDFSAVAPAAGVNSTSTGTTTIPAATGGGDAVNRNANFNSANVNAVSSSTTETTIADIFCSRSVSSLLTLLPPGFVDKLLGEAPATTAPPSAPTVIEDVVGVVAEEQMVV